MNIKLHLDFDINVEEGTITVSGDSKGIYQLKAQLHEEAIIHDAVKSYVDPVEKALLKVTDPQLHYIIYRDEYSEEEQERFMFKSLKRN